MMWFLQIAQLSTTISQVQSATTFHFFFISNLLAFLVDEEWAVEEEGSGVLEPFPVESIDAIEVEEGLRSPPQVSWIKH